MLISFLYFHLQNSKPKTESQNSKTQTSDNGTGEKPEQKRTDSCVSVASSCLEICRICHCEAEADMPLISPCLCSGSLAWVHQACLQKWIKSSDTKRCELCKYEFHMQSTMKPFRKVSRLNF